jgi:hypothetical protein
MRSEGAPLKDALIRPASCSQIPQPVFLGKTPGVSPYRLIGNLDKGCGG